MSLFDAIETGRSYELGSHFFRAEEIKRFAAKYDPQKFHTDEDAAKRSVLGGLCASGWHTTGVYMRLNVAHLKRVAEEWVAAGNAAPKFGLLSPGFRNLRWLKPIYAGETIVFRQTVNAKRRSASRLGWGLIEFTPEATNERGETVFTFEGTAFMSTD